jgi:hypothetical protein
MVLNPELLFKVNVFMIASEAGKIVPMTNTLNRKYL